MRDSQTRQRNWDAHSRISRMGTRDNVIWRIRSSRRQNTESTEEKDWTSHWKKSQEESKTYLSLTQALDQIYRNKKPFRRLRVSQTSILVEVRQDSDIPRDSIRGITNFVIQRFRGEQFLKYFRWQYNLESFWIDNRIDYARTVSDIKRSKRMTKKALKRWWRRNTTWFRSVVIGLDKSRLHHGSTDDRSIVLSRARRNQRLRSWSDDNIV